MARIKKNKVTYKLSASKASVEEGGAITYTLTRSGDIKKKSDSVSVNFSGAADKGSDFDVSGLLGGRIAKFKANQKVVKFTVSTKEDDVAEGAESLIVKTAKTAPKKATIIDDDVPTYSIAANPISVSEGAAITYTVTRTGDAREAGSVAVALSGSAAIDSDYSVAGLTGTTTLTAVFAAGARTATFTVATKTDSAAEATETVVATLGPITGGGRLGGLREATGAILDDASGGTARVSVGLNGAEAEGNAVFGPSISTDGRYVAFAGEAANHVAGDTNGVADIFVFDRETFVTTRVSVGPNGAQAIGQSLLPSISGDGDRVAFESTATNLVTGDTNGQGDVFVFDKSSNTTVRVSFATNGTQANGASTDAAISRDGDKVAFSSAASNLVAADLGGNGDIFVRDIDTNQTVLVSKGIGGTSANGNSGQASISETGRYVSFSSVATNLALNDGNGNSDVFLFDQDTGTTIRVSNGMNGAESNGGSSESAISDDGRYVAFTSGSTNLVANDTNGRSDVFLFDTSTGTTTRISVATDGTQSTSFSFAPDISSDGRYVTFFTGSALVADDTNNTADIYVRDIVNGTTTRVSTGPGGVQGNGLSLTPSISGDGREIAFASVATNLVPGDTKGYQDIFVHEML